MANSTKAFGLRPLGKVGGSYASGGQDQFYILDNESTSIYQGDLTALTATGTVVAVTSSATGQILGVFNGCLIEVSPNNRNKPTWQNYYSQTDVSQGNIYAYVVDDPNQVYLVKSTGTALGVSAVGNAFDILYAAGSTVNGISAVALDLAASNSSTGQCLVISPSTFIGNEVNSTNEDYVVRINKGQQLI